MTGLPASIEAYLQETGFSPTEILVLKRLLEGEAMTLRELAAKTGKSTGVLDQATKKLISKKILTKEQINDGLKYTLDSVQSIAKWVEKDMQEKRNSLQRKHQNFESFLSTVTLDRSRPDMEYFEGSEGVQKAYMKLLDQGCTEFLHYIPVQYKEEEDPLRDFRVQYFRERRKRGIFSRVITHNTVLGKRYQSRDTFEYRKTILIPQERCPFSFEQIICGDIFACFNHEENKVCFIKFPELAESERRFFEAVWQNPGDQVDKIVDPEEEKRAHEISMRTKTLSALREFFISRKSIAIFALLAVLSGMLTYGLYSQNMNNSIERIREKVTSIAATGALQFSAEEVNQIRTLEDANKPIYRDIVERLDQIRKGNDQIVYAYIIRQKYGNTYEFVVDADAPDPFAAVDTNEDGIVDEADQLGVPGLAYDVSDKDALANKVFTEPAANSEPYSDQWGSFMTGYAPIKDATGNVVAVLAIDMWASAIEEITNKDFVPLYYFLGFFLFFVIVRVSAFNRSLAKEVLKLLKNKRVITLITGLSGLLIVILLLINFYTYSLLKNEIANRLVSIVATAAPEINASDLERIHIARDMQTEEYQRVFTKLNEIRINNPNILYAYIMRPSDVEGYYQFVVDADSNYFLPYPTDPDPIEVIAPGTFYDINQLYVSDQQEYLLNIPIHSKDFISDKWGTYITATAPIYKNDEPIAILGIDMNAKDAKEYIRKKNKELTFMVIFLILIISVSLRILTSNFSK